MSDSISFRAGEFSSKLIFYSSDEKLFDDVNLAVFDENTSHFFPSVVPRFVWPVGEAEKGWSSIESLLRVCLSSGLARDSVLAGVGGGVVTDMAAFAASLYMRGCGLVLIPTTLLGMVDAAIGGKTGVDFEGFKNLVGTFYPAREIRIWPGVLTSLPEREYLGGLAEVIKHGLLGEARLLKLLREEKTSILARNVDSLNEIVRLAAVYKVGVVERDFRESGERAFLNLGHTFAHALEAAMGFDGRWIHGEAVAWGIDRALDLGARLGVTDPAWRDEVHGLLLAYGYRLSAPEANADAIFSAMHNDKKKSAGTVRFVLQKRFGETFQNSVEDFILKKTIEGGL